MYLDYIISAFKRVNAMELKVAYLEAKIADLEQRLSRKPKPKTTQVQLTLEFNLDMEGDK